MGLPQITTISSVINGSLPYTAALPSFLRPFLGDSLHQEGGVPTESTSSIQDPPYLPRFTVEEETQGSLYHSPLYLQSTHKVSSIQNRKPYWSVEFQIWQPPYHLGSDSLDRTRTSRCYLEEARVYKASIPAPCGQCALKREAMSHG